MTAADKLRELLATRPAGPNTEELQRWWKATGMLLPGLLEDLEALDCDLVATRAELRRERDDRAYLRVELDRERIQHTADVAGFESALAQERHENEILERSERDLRAAMGIAEISDEIFEEGRWRSCTGCHELNEGHPTGPYTKILRCNLGSGCRECGGIGAVWEQGHPKSWLDCPECKSRSKAGACPPRCEEWVAMEEDRKRANGALLVNPHGQILKEPA